MQKHGRPTRRASRLRVACRRVGALLAVASVGLGGALALGISPSGATPPPYDNPNFNPESGVGANTYTSEVAFNAACPQSIAETPGSEPAAKALNNDLNTEASFTPGGTVHYVFYDNPNFASQNFTLQDCIATYPADEFTAADFDEFGVLRNASKTDLTSNATSIDQVGLNGIVQSDGIIYYSWTAPGSLTPGSWICNFARDVATGHGGEGNRKSMAVCYQVIASVTPTAPTHDETTDCGVEDTYTIPLKTGVTYKVDDVITGTGTYDLPAGTTVDITAEANDGYFIPGDADIAWSYTGSTVEECTNPVDPKEPTHTESSACGVADSYTIPSSDGVTYVVGQVVTAAGTYTLPAGTTVVITAVPNDSVFAEGVTTSWTFTGSEVPVCETITQGGGDPTPVTTTTVAPTTSTTEAPTTTTSLPELAFTGAPEAVEAEVPTTTTTVPAAPELPFTGSNTTTLAMVAVGMLSLGALCVAASRRKRTTT